ncbi:hypothetical protein B0J14DRAFT_220928 [Halenospora varia]|nr:hypothetical protein B0J14DRAFT_220928 [Halenospora varia]
MASKQPSDTKPRCSQCGISIGRPFDLGRHMKERHGPPKVCPVCGHETHRKSRMDNHRKKKHGYPLDTVPLSVPQNFDMHQTPQGMSGNGSFGSQAHISTSSQAHTQFVPGSKDREYLQPTNISRNTFPPSEVPLSAMDYGYASEASENTTVGNFQAHSDNSISMPHTFQPPSSGDFMGYSDSSQPPMNYTTPLEGQALLDYPIPPHSVTGPYMTPSIPASHAGPGSMYASYLGNHQPLQSDASSSNSGMAYDSTNASQTPCSCCGRLDHQHF